jgi:hypothetical protein
LHLTALTKDYMAMPNIELIAHDDGDDIPFVNTAATALRKHVSSPKSYSPTPALCRLGL